MDAFTKLAPEIVQSSIWNEPSDIRIVWITLLAIKDAEGYVRGDSQVISRMANVPVESVIIALEKFQQPDKNSHTPDNEGRRIAPAPGGWIVLNHWLYRIEDRKQIHAEYMRKWRKDVNVNKCDSQVSHPSASVSVLNLKGGVGGINIPTSLNTTEFTEAWKNWVQHRKEIKKPLTVKSVEMQMKEFVAWGPTGAVEAIEYTIKKGWQGIRRPENETNSKPSRKPYAESKTVIRDRAIREIVLALEASKAGAVSDGDYQDAVTAMSDKYRDMPGVLKEALEMIKGRQKSLVKTVGA